MRTENTHRRTLKHQTTGRTAMKKRNDATFFIACPYSRPEVGSLSRDDVATLKSFAKAGGTTLGRYTAKLLKRHLEDSTALEEPTTGEQ